MNEPCNRPCLSSEKVCGLHRRDKTTKRKLVLEENDHPSKRKQIMKKKFEGRINRRKPGAVISKRFNDLLFETKYQLIHYASDTSVIATSDDKTFLIRIPSSIERLRPEVNKKVNIIRSLKMIW